MSHFIHTLNELHDSSGIAVERAMQDVPVAYADAQAHSVFDMQPKTQRSPTQWLRASFLFRQRVTDDHGTPPVVSDLPSKWEW